MGENRPMEDRLHYIETQNINLNYIDITGSILDIGGGGEGIIGQRFGQSVVAIDPSKDELKDAAEGPLKIIMDARELKFIDCSFENATSFFTMMYISQADHEKVLREIFRVLKPGGELHIWDAVIPKFYEPERDIYVVPLNIIVRDKKIKTGYGIRWRDKEQSARYYINLCEKAGFKLIDNAASGEIFYIRLKKK